MAKFSIGDRVYASKKQAYEAAQAVLHSYEPNQRVVDVADEIFLGELLLLHRSAEEKIGCGVEFFWVKRNFAGNKEFWFTRVDGSETDWSFRQCLTNSTPRQDTTSAFRSAIRFQIAAFKDKVFEDSEVVRCAVSGEPVTRKDAHVDHEIPFADLLEKFLVEQKLSIEDVELEKSRDGETENYLADKNLHVDWVWWHLERAELRIVTKQVNLSRKRRA